MLGDDNSNVTVSVTSHSNQLVTEFLSVFLPTRDKRTDSSPSQEKNIALISHV